MRSASTVAETQNDSESSLADCCPPATHAVVLRTLELDALSDNDVAVLLPFARAMLSTTLDSANVANAEEGRPIPWWARTSPSCWVCSKRTPRPR